MEGCPGGCGTGGLGIVIAGASVTGMDRQVDGSPEEEEEGEESLSCQQ